MKRAAAVLCLIAAPAMAGNPPCGPREDMVALLGDDWEEQPRAVGMEQTGAWIEVFANLETGSWTFLRSTTDGQACMIAAGSMWQDMLPQQPAGDDL
jgi:hypothetical protein